MELVLFETPGTFKALAVTPCVFQGYSKWYGNRAPGACLCPVEATRATAHPAQAEQRRAALLTFRVSG